MIKTFQLLLFGSLLKFEIYLSSLCQAIECQRCILVCLKFFVLEEILCIFMNKTERLHIPKKRFHQTYFLIFLQLYNKPMVCRMNEQVLSNLNQRSARLPEGLGGIGVRVLSNVQPEVVQNLPNQQVTTHDQSNAQPNHNPTKTSLHVFCSYTAFSL